MKNKLNIYFSIVLMMLSFFSVINALNMINYDYSIMMEWLITSINSCNIYMTLIFDFMSMIFFSTVSFISSIVILYSGDYMKEEKFIDRFIYIVMMFVLSMMLLILSPNMISLIIGWDGLGLVSYCLVIYYQNNLSNNAGMLTALMNRIGDVMILMSIAWMLNFGSWNFISFIDKMNMNNMMMLIIIAGFTKSAQIPFSSWLPAAMAAPTPVSALVHSSTLVTAGVYLLIRFNLIIMQFNLIKLMMLMSIITMIMSGMGANFEFDLKKIIALSTLSQLGMMMIILLIGYPLLSFFHLIIHALFKASLFLCAGIIIHNFNNNQDIRMMGCLSYQMPLTMTMMNIANMSLCGMPFMSGFYSKDLIMEMICSQNQNIFVLILMFIGVILTSFYTARLTFYSMNTDFNFYKLSSMMESMNYMMMSIMMLTAYSIMSGSLFSWLILMEVNIIIIPFELSVMTLVLVMISAWISYEISMFSKSKMTLLNEFIGSMWYMKQISTFHNQLFVLNPSKNFQKFIDLGWGELLGPMGLVNLNFKLTFLNMKIIENNFKIQMISFIFWMILLLLI
uniref:NADH-ubiquinone oxidoreductase chain 5 n=1 Tax=Planopleura kaempferi TaxID=3381683 RepID=A0A344ALW3_9HEMI|nr:NADH dehydrogenase subunit 5 [Platypleura kaempferi]AWV84479.1 NADH dehydrogenase subunit 5 [Platypleura kaempferi]